MPADCPPSWHQGRSCKLSEQFCVNFRDEQPGDAAGQPHHLEGESTIPAKDPRLWRSLIKENRCNLASEFELTTHFTPLGNTFAANDWAAIFPFRITKVSVANS